jgi:hypothetical protein
MSRFHDAVYVGENPPVGCASAANSCQLFGFDALAQRHPRRAFLRHLSLSAFADAWRKRAARRRCAARVTRVDHETAHFTKV